MHNIECWQCDLWSLFPTTHFADATSITRRFSRNLIGALRANDSFTKWPPLVLWWATDGCFGCTRRARRPAFTSWRGDAHCEGFVPLSSLRPICRHGGGSRRLSSPSSLSNVRTQCWAPGGRLVVGEAWRLTVVVRHRGSGAIRASEWCPQYRPGT